MSALTYGDFALPGRVIHRIFLPFIAAAPPDEERPARSPWAPLATARGLELDAGTRCVDVLGWPDESSETPRWSHPQGRAPRETVSAIRELLASLAGPDSWTFTPHDRAWDGRPPAPDAFWSAWMRGHLPGSLRCQQQLLLSAPRYADSVIVSAPQDVTHVATSLGLEIVRAAPSRPLPELTW